MISKRKQHSILFTEDLPIAPPHTDKLTPSYSKTFFSENPLKPALHKCRLPERYRRQRKKHHFYGPLIELKPTTINAWWHYLKVANYWVSSIWNMLELWPPQNAIWWWSSSSSLLLFVFSIILRTTEIFLENSLTRTAIHYVISIFILW